MRFYRCKFFKKSENGGFLRRNAGTVAYTLEKERHYDMIT